MSKDQSPEQVAQAALALLKKSVVQTPTTSSQSRSNRHQESTKTGQSSTASAKLMANLWILMTAMYGHKWTSVHGETDSQDIWGKVLHGINGQQIAAGMQACSVSQDPWPPSAPEFRALCEAGVSSLGIPSVDAAWREAVEASSDPTTWKFSHPIVQEAARLTDWYSIRTGTPKAETVQNRFNKRYADLTAKLQRGEPLVEGQLLLSQEAAQDEREKAERANDQAVLDRIKAQGLDKKTPEQLRAEMRAKLGIKR